MTILKLAMPLVVALGACASSVAPDPGLEHLALAKVAPKSIIPGTSLALAGESFVDEMWGAATLHLTGQADGQGIDVRWPAKFVDFNTMTVAITSGNLDEVGGEVDFEGTATVEVLATTDDKTYASMPLTVELSFRETLTPAPTGVLDGVHFVNDQIEVDGDGFLLGGDEGASVARITGCFTLDSGGGCTPVASVDVPLLPREPLSREKASFAFAPAIAGIRPGSFTGEVTIVNHQMNRPEIAAAPISSGFTLVTAQIFTVNPASASLGQYMFVNGGGFVGGETGASTELDLVGTFNKTGSNPAPISMTLIPEFVEGKLVRYVLNTDDQLGRSLDLRTDTGEFTGTITPVVTYKGVTVRGEDTPASLSIAPVRQVVFLNFTPSYVEGLRDFGMRAVEKRIRDRILEVCTEVYKGVNIEFRITPVTDYALYEHVDITGIDPNDMGLFGYDNSPGKDNGNVRLYDRLGGVNAVTQSDGYPGYGGVFIRSLMGFSKHPGAFARSIEGADPLFDQIFDRFRADVDGGSPIVGADLSSGFQPRTSSDGCPASARLDQIECGVFVLGNLIGGTLSHEIGHSLGLANPFSEGFHNAGDQPNRIMDSGGDRPFLERAEMGGLGPGVFCDDEYAYLRMILPSSEPENPVLRPGCF